MAQGKRRWFLARLEALIKRTLLTVCTIVHILLESMADDGEWDSRKAAANLKSMA